MAILAASILANDIKIAVSSLRTFGMSMAKVACAIVPEKNVISPYEILRDTNCVKDPLKTITSVPKAPVISKKIIVLELLTPKKIRSRQILINGISVKIVDVEIGDAVLSDSNIQMK